MVAFHFENPVQHSPVLSQFFIYTLYDTHILHISGSSFLHIFVLPCAWGVVSCILQWNLRDSFHL